MCEAFVEFDYIAKKQDELSIKKGDIVKDVVKKQPGWYEGVLNEKRGLFPDKFVKLIDKDVIFRNKKESHSLRQCKVIFSYQPLHPDELTLNVGDIIDIIGEDEEGWWKGLHNSKEGVFPSNFVEEIYPTKPRTISSINLDDLPNDIELRIPNLPPKPAKILCEVKYPYKAQNEDELNLKEGDIITLTNQELADPGWWEGELFGKIGVFPDNFVTVLKHSDDPKPYSKLTADLINLKTTATVSQRPSLEPRNEADNKPNPPILKKPELLKKVSPSAVKGFRGLIGNRKNDAVDGIASSKSPTGRNDVKIDGKKEKNGESGFDQVERTPLLKDVRAGRAKPPIRRPPTSAVTKDKSPAFESDQSSEDDEEVVVVEEEETAESKPSVREWEKHKAPWLEEMKMNQAKRSSTSPISEKNLNMKGGLYPELEKSPVENLMSKSMPCPTITPKISPNDLSSIDTNKIPSSGAKVKPNNLQNLSRNNNYSNIDIPQSISPNTNNGKPPISTSNKYHTKLTNSTNESNRVSGEFAQEVMSLTVQQYSELIDRIHRLEAIVDKQATAIDELRSKMYIETDKRKLMDAQQLT